MKKCPKCNVIVDTERKICPLCYEVLKKIDDEKVKHPPYPEYEIKPTKKNIFLRILGFITILGIIASVIANVFTYQTDRVLWSIIVILALAYLWIILKSTISSKANVAIRLIIQMLAVSALMIGIDSVSNWTGWSINYIIPFLSMAGLLSIIFVVLIKPLWYQEYLMYLLDTIILGFIPFILWLFKVVDILWPSLAAASLSIATIIGMLVFNDKETREEMKRRFHI